MFGVILVGFGFYAIDSMITNTILSNLILITGFVDCVGGLFVHLSLCIQAVSYKRITDNGKINFEILEKLTRINFKICPAL